MCNWLYGSNKKRISSSELLSALPAEESVRRNAYKIWEDSGRTHGHDVADWTAAEGNLYGEMWQSLGTVQT